MVGPFSTARLLLRPFTLADLDDVWAYQRRPEVARFMSWSARDREQSRRSLEQIIREDGLRVEGDCLALAVVLRDTGRVVGHVELVWRSRAHRRGELGYVLDPRHQGHGYATEAATEMLRYGFEEFGLHRIVARCNTRNTASARLMERLGMRREAHFRECAFGKGEWRDEYVYALLRTEWTRTPHQRGG
ncbi:GNAT family protein [Micromonospora sp. NBRC 101691]|uniref:GNAT family N-acetyltransferase n=1 Tax=Micromonospora sp. NBRC 101691 TaxID=3032198 RepID=UPI0024A5DE55|nr:GNAT family protein [Micromonospora sp. NBRC 101691]GLY20829.1 N-acetyltransferase [Micromonospora sp. NBRC 101691]